jgi:hypothetical protein
MLAVILLATMIAFIGKRCPAMKSLWMMNGNTGFYASIVESGAEVSESIALRMAFSQD